MTITRNPVRHIHKHSPPSSFGSHVFHFQTMKEQLPSKTALHLQRVMQGLEAFRHEEADTIAEALRAWAQAKGATHYAHWFQPLSGKAAEKQTSFLDWGHQGELIERLRGKDLFSGEPDASSFPSGHLRATHEARGYTTWDLLNFPFLWESQEGTILYIPALFFSWKGDALDHKIPLLRSEQKLDRVVKRLLHLFHLPRERIYSSLGPEQEYFLIDRSVYQKRPDLLLTGRTLFGRKPSKGQELEDHYFSALPERSLAFLKELEDKARELGIPLKARHHEVAPAQYECAPLFERAALASDHNLLLMDLMQLLAQKHNLACLFHEKPFAHINGSGKHNNWSIMTDQGENLLDPQQEPRLFLTLLTAILHAVHTHSALLRASIASHGNDQRLGGSEAPPTILSVYLGAPLEEWLARILAGESLSVAAPEKIIELGLSHLPTALAESSDRNRTSFFAFTGNKFEFRAVGASMHCSWPITIINAIVADSLQLLLDEIEAQEQPLEQLLPILRKSLQQSQSVLFGGNGYSKEWESEAARRGLPNTKKSVHALSALLTPPSQRVLEDVCQEQELQARYHIFIEQYAKTLLIETGLLIDLFRTHLLPAARSYQTLWAKSLLRLRELHILADADSLSTFSANLATAERLIHELEHIRTQTESLGWDAKAKVLCELASVKMEEARHAIDCLEGWVDQRLWPLPTYHELLYSL